MRLPSAILISSVILAGVWAQAALPPGAPTPVQEPALLEDALSGLSQRLAAAGAMPLSTVSTQFHEAGHWQVRGRTERRGGAARGYPATFYAELRLVCDAGLAEPNCWELSRLEIDGRAVASEDVQ